MKSFYALLILSTSILFSQEQFPSTHQQEWEFYRDHPEMVGTTVVPPLLSKRSDLMKVQSMNKVVYGFHPYWQNGSESNYYFSMLTHLAYFSGDVDAATGNFTSTHSWASANVVSLAQSYGVKVHFTVVLFSDHATLLGSTTAKNNLIANIMTQINLRNADGCNIDFESISGSQALPLRTFLKQLGDTLKAYNKEFVVELFAVDWNTVFPAAFFSTLDPVVDYYFIMLYAYYYSGSSTSGPNAPLRSTTASGYHVLKSIKSYTDLGCPANKLIAGFPNYGHDWPTTTNGLLAPTTGTGSSRTYTVVKNNYIDTIPPGQQYWNTTYNTRWYYYHNGTSWRQCWYDDSVSWGMKFDSIKVKNVGGTGMWALGYDGTEPELWGALKTAFASTANPAHTSLDNFESGVGHFDKYPRWSGSTTGIDITSSQSASNDFANNGYQSMSIVLVDSSEVSSAWTVRLVSGSGSRSNNVQISNSGYIGYWLKTSSAPAGAQVAVTIDDQRTGSTDKTELSPKTEVINDGQWHLYEWNLQGSGWTSFAGGNGVIDSATVSMDAIMIYAPNNASTWTMYIDDVSRNASGTLPVELNEFNVFNNKLQVNLLWQTVSETNNYGFEIERKTIDNGKLTIDNWIKIGFVEGRGTVSSPQSYSFTDLVDRSGTYVYRLRQIDRNGQFKYSAEMNVTITGYPETYSLGQNFPNPFNPTTTFQFTIPDGAQQQNTTLKIFDMLGREVTTLVNEQKEGGIYSVQWNATGLASGIYFYTLRSGDFSETKKLLFVK